MLLFHKGGIITNKNKTFSELMQAFDILIDKRLKDSPYTVFQEGEVTSIPTSGVDQVYTVRVDGVETSAYCLPNLFLDVGDIVTICIPNGDFSKRFIDHKRDLTTALSGMLVIIVDSSKILALADSGKLQKCSSINPITITIPLNSVVDFPIRTEIKIFRYGTGTVTIAAEPNVVLNAANNETTIPIQYDMVTIKKIASDEWLLLQGQTDLTTTNSNVTAAQTQATLGVTNAAIAQATANGKNEVTYSLAVPGAVANAIGDIWFQKDALNIIIGQWEGLGGTSWSVKTIGNTVIANLDAGKITAGYISADRIQTGTIIAAKLVAGTITAASAVIADAAITNAKIDRASINKLVVTTADIESATITNLTAHTAHITNGIIDNATIDIAKVNNLSATYATITNLTAATGNIASLTSNVASINSLLAGNIGVDQLAAGAIQAGSAVIGTGAIASAQIITLDVSKLNAGNISTNKFTVQSDSGNLKIQGNTIKAWDTAGKERVSLGLNGTDYNLLIRGTDGTTVLFGTDGVTHAGITQGAVDDTNVATNANINGQKLDINSVVSSINGATTLLKSSHMVYDPTGQTFEVAFGALKGTVTDQGTNLTNNYSTTSQTATLLSSKVTQTQVDTSIGAIVGGKNLIPNSLNGWIHYTTYSGESFVNDYLRSTKNTMKPYVGITNLTNMPLGTKIALIFTIRGNKNGNITAQLLGSPFGAIASGSSLLAITTIATQYITIITATDNVTGFAFDGTAFTTNGDYIEFKNVQMLNFTALGETETDLAKLAIKYPYTLQGQIDATNTNITNNYSTITQTANNITSAVGAVSTNLSNNYSTTSAMNSAISQSAGGITLSVSQTYATQANVNAIQVGGRNLVLNSVIAETSNVYDFGVRNLSINLISGKTYTISINGRVNAQAIADGKSLMCYLFGAGSVPFTHITSLVDTTVSTTFICNSTGTATIHCYMYNVGGSRLGAVTVNWVKVEIGNKATDWTPAPEDQTAYVDAVQVGGRNLLKASDTILVSGADFPTCSIVSNVLNTQLHWEGTVTSTGLGSPGQAYQYTMCQSYMSEFPKDSQDYTLSFEYKTNNSGSTIQIDIRFPMVVKKFSALNTNNIWVRGSIVCNWTITTQTGSLFLVGTTNVSGNYISYRNLKLEIGNKATDWTPAPEDVQGQIDSATTRISTAETTITQNTNSIALKASQTDLTTTNSNVTTAQTQATLGVTNAGLAQTKANQGVTDALTAHNLADTGIANALTAQTQANLGVTNALAAQTKANQGVADALVAHNLADTGIVNAAAAQTKATTVTQAVTDMSDDNILTPIEKSQLKKEWAVMVAEKPTYDTLATTFAITTEKTAYDTAYTNLDTPLNNITNGYFLTMLTNTAIVGTTFRALFDDYYDKKALLIKKVNETAKTRADLGVTNAATAQTQANTGVANALAAQGTANTGVTNAATAQTAANLANTNATALTTRVTTAETKITPSAIIATVSSTYTTPAEVATQATTIAQTAANIKIGFNAINAAQVTFDINGLLVDKGAYRIKDVGGTEYTVTADSNMVNDHSFELVGTSGINDMTYDDYAVVSNGNTFMWNAVSTPRLVSNANRSYINGLTEFGLKAIACTPTQYVEQYIMVKPSIVYTLSGYAKPHTRNVAGSAVTARFWIDYYNSSLALISSVNVALALTTNYSAANINLDLERLHITFTTPTTCVTIRIRPYATTGWVIWDGIQLVKGSYPALYNPENQLWNYINLAYGFTIASHAHDDRYYTEAEVNANFIRPYYVANLCYLDYGGGTLVVRNSAGAVVGTIVL